MPMIMPGSSEKAVAAIFAQAGIAINGRRPWDIQVARPEFHDRVLRGGSLAMGETYMAGWWDCPRLDQFFFQLLANDLDQKVKKSPALLLCSLKAALCNCQSPKRALAVGEQHYDAGNKLFELMLDQHMAYSCAYWNGSADLTAAQEAKLELICRKIKLRPGMRVLDIGCGWGSFVRYAARNYGVEAVGVTISREQAKLARQRCAGLPIDIHLRDYRELDGEFDRIVSVGMFEHVGGKNYRQFMQVAHRCLKPGGLFLLHTIASDQSTRHCDPWFDKYIFPNGMLPSIKQLGRACEKLFVLEDLHNIGSHYDRTLTTWFANFDRNWPALQQDYSVTFYRMWKYYLLSLAGAFRARRVHVWQVVFSKGGEPGGYQSCR